jgi:hypothetical protein
MKSNTSKIILVIILLLVVLFARLYKGQIHDHAPMHPIGNHEPQHAPVDIAPSGSSFQSAIDANASLIYTHHARCRMDCRHISESDIREVLREGHINPAKSQQNETPCPIYAIEEDRHKDGVRLRIVFAKCDNEVKVVTCIDRDHEFDCDCK